MKIRSQLFEQFCWQIDQPTNKTRQKSFPGNLIGKANNSAFSHVYCLNDANLTNVQKMAKRQFVLFMTNSHFNSSSSSGSRCWNFYYCI